MSPSPIEEGVIKTKFAVNKQKELKQGSFRIPRVTSFSGSIVGSGLLDRRLVEEDAMGKVQADKSNEVKTRQAAYEKCKGGCACDGHKCLGAGLYYCRFCNICKKKKCGAKICMERYSETGCEDAPLPKKIQTKAPPKKKRKVAPVLSESESAASSDSEAVEAADSDSESDTEAVTYAVGNLHIQCIVRSIMVWIGFE